MATRVFYTSDIHGSEKCFKKFLSAGKFYKAQILIMGGDITGKMIVPIVGTGQGRYELTFLGIKHRLKKEEELLDFEQRIRDSGYYPFRTSAGEMKELDADPEKREQLFLKLMIESVRGWMELADKKLKDQDVKCFLNTGNDDRFEIDPIIQNCGVLTMPEGRVLMLDDRHEMISTGFSNPTPWNCPRDIPEDELLEKIEKMVSEVRDMSNCIFNMHVPPYDTTIDEAPRLDKNLTPIRSGSGELMMESVGSKAVRIAIEKHQPLVGLHGHIHEGKGKSAIGKTVVLNCGSEYSEGILHGVILELENKKMKYQFTTG